MEVSQHNNHPLLFQLSEEKQQIKQIQFMSKVRSSWVHLKIILKTEVEHSCNLICKIWLGWQL